MTNFSINSCAILFNERNWKKHEPEELRPEKQVWLKQNILRAISEGFITYEEANDLLDEEIKIKKPKSLSKKQSFIRLPLKERYKLLAKQAEKIANVYEQDYSVEDFQEGDIIDYK